MIFIDEVEIRVEAGRGGNGCVAFRREKFEPRGGPSGGDGGHGGDVVLIGAEGLGTLQHLRFNSVYRADRGRHGEGSNRTGKSGDSITVPVPLGTLVYDRDSGDLLGEILVVGEPLKVASGGRGGRGNARFATSRRRAPRFAQDGEPGGARGLRLELKLLADVGLVGLPNAGKSTLISTISAARPKIADYPFTTLVPQLGVVAEGPLAEPFVIADLPGLIAGAAQGAGLGHQFLRHVERCRVLVHLVELAPPTADGDPGAAVADLETLEAELRDFNPELLERQRLVVGSKSDAALDERRESLQRAARERGLPYHEISSATRDGLSELIHLMRRHLLAAREKAAAETAAEAAEEDA